MGLIYLLFYRTTTLSASHIHTNALVLRDLVTLNFDLCVACTAVLQMLTERFNINVPHLFVDHKFISPAFCDHCGSMIFGLVRPELQCRGISFYTIHSIIQPWKVCLSILFFSMISLSVRCYFVHCEPKNICHSTFCL